MKKLILLILTLSATVKAADSELQNMAEMTAIVSTDILYILDDPSGTPASEKITALNLFDMIKTFALLDTIVADKNLANLDDAMTWVALGTFNLGLTITTGDPFTLGANRIDNGSDLLDGEMIGADTIDDDSIDFTDVTGVDLTLTDCGAITSTGTITATVGFDIVGAADIDYGSADVTDHTFLSDGTGTGEFVLKAGAIDGTEILDDTIDSADYAAGSIDAEHLAADIIDETKIADDGIDSEHYNDGSIDAVHLAADVIDETKIADDGIDSEHYNNGSIDLVHLAAGVYAKDLVTTSPITGAADNIFVGADSDVTIALDFTAAWDFGGAASVELPQHATPTTDATGEIALDTTITDHQPLWQYYDGDENMTIVALPTANLNSTDNYIIKYDAASDDFQMEADVGAAGGDAWSDAVDSDILPTGADNTYDLGSVAASFKNGYFEGTLEAGTLTEGGIAVHNNDEMDASSELLAIMDDETGTGLLVFNDVPTFNEGIYINRLHDTASWAPYLLFQRARDGDPTDDVSSGDYTGRINFRGYHTDGYDESATIQAIVDATPGNGDMPGRLEFLTSVDGAASPTLRVAIDSAGNTKMGDGAWTNYTNVSINGTITPEGTADLELPQASPAVPDADGEVELDFTDGKMVIQHGSAHAELGGSTDIVMGSLIDSWSGTIYEPDGVNDVITVKAINSIEYPHGVVITAVYLGISSNTNYVLTVQNFDDFDTINAGDGTIDTVTYTADTTGEVIDSSPTYATIAAGQIIMISIPATDVDWIHFEIYFYEPAA